MCTFMSTIVNLHIILSVSVLKRFQCQCHHNTGGDNCEVCLPLYNQHPWRTGGIQGIGCEGRFLDCCDKSERIKTRY